MPRKLPDTFVYRGEEAERLDRELQPLLHDLRDLEGETIGRLKLAVDQIRGAPLPVTRAEFAHLVSQHAHTSGHEYVRAERMGGIARSVYENEVARRIAAAAAGVYDGELTARELRDQLHFLGEADGARGVRRADPAPPEHGIDTRSKPKRVITDADRILAPE